MEKIKASVGAGWSILAVGLTAGAAYSVYKLIED